jgi:hypothetical protein
MDLNYKSEKKFHMYILFDYPSRCCEKSKKQFKNELNIVTRIRCIGYILANCDYLFINTKMLEDMWIKR